MRRKAAGLALTAALILSGCLGVRDGGYPESGMPCVQEASNGTEMEMIQTAGAQTEESGTGEAQVTESQTEEAQTDEESEAMTTEEETVYTAEETAQTTEQTAPEHAGSGQELPLGRTLSDSVKQINARTMSAPASNVADVFSLTFTTSSVKEMIERYAFPEYPLLSGQALTETDRARIEENRNLPALSEQETLNVSYGILMENAAVRSFPTDERLTADNAAGNFDYFQESLLFLGEPVALLHTSLDGRYTFVQGLNYNGWIRTEYIQVCGAPLAQAVRNCADFAVITDNFCEIDGWDNEKLLRMGTVLPLLNETAQGYTAALFCAAEHADGCLVFEDGALHYYNAEYAPENAEVLWVRECVLPKTAAHIGYMDFTADNILLLASHMLGSSYSWGDEYAGYDCSSTVGSIYRCFGIILPRNSGILKYTGANVADLSGMTAAEKRAYITALPVGTILVLPGHAMMYVGEQKLLVSGQEQKSPAMLHCVTGYVDADGVEKEPYACVITSIDIYTRGTQSYLDMMNTCVSFTLE